MVIRRSLRRLSLGLAVAGLAGCSVLTGLTSASKPLDLFELTPLPATSTGATRGRRHLEVATPTANGALTSDRIVVKPTALQVQSLPDARWVSEAPELVQLLLVRSLSGTGRFGLVTHDGSGPSPDYTLLTDLQAFQAEIVPDGVNVVVRIRMSLLRGPDDVIVSSRSFSNSVMVADTETEVIVPAFDQVMTEQLRDVTDWLIKNTAG